MLKFRLTMTALAISSAMPAYAGSDNTFSATHFFGDSHTDSGYFAPITTRLGNPSGKFTTNPDKVWAEHLAERYATNAQSIRAGGTNYAVGGALSGTDTVNSRFGMDIPVPATTSQVAQYLAQSGGKADGKALYGITSGSSDLVAAMGNPANATNLLTAAAQQTAQAVKDLHAAGANYIVVANVPDAGVLPAGAAQKTQATTASAGYNTLLQNELANSGANVVPLNTFALVQEIAAHPNQYGLNNVAQPACNPPTASALLCTASSLIAPDANQTHLFADATHLSGAGHQLLGDYAISVLDAPAQIGSIGQHIVQQSIQKDQDIHRQINRLPENKKGLWVEMGQQKRDDNWSESHSIPSLSVGVGFGNKKAGHTGFHLNAGYQEQNWHQGGSYKTQTIGGGAFHRHDFGKLRLTGTFHYDHHQIETDRRAKLGKATRQHKANGDAHRFGAGLRAAYRLQPSANFAIAPHLGVNAQRVIMSQFDENQEKLSTAMSFRKNQFESVNGEIGVDMNWHLTPNTALTGSLNHSHNFLDKQDDIEARVKSLPANIFKLPAAETSQHLTTASIGVRHLVGGSSLNLGITGYKGSDKVKGYNAFMGVTYEF